MSRPSHSTAPETTVAQLVARAKRSASPVEIRVRDSDLVVTVLPKHELDKLRALRQFESKAVKKHRPKTPAQYLAETERKLRRYEKKYKMSSALFYHKFQRGELSEEELDYFDWRVYYHAYKRLKRKQANGKRQTA